MAWTMNDSRNNSRDKSLNIVSTAGDFWSSSSLRIVYNVVFWVMGRPKLSWLLIGHLFGILTEKSDLEDTTKKKNEKNCRKQTPIFIFTLGIVRYSGRVNWCCLGSFNTTIYSTGQKKGSFPNEDPPVLIVLFETSATGGHVSIDDLST